MNINIKEEDKENILAEVKKVCERCYNCPLGKTRTNLVFSAGNPHAKLLLIGEAPGHTEDMRGIPFVGRAGQLLDKILLSQNITREKNIYICNTVKCRPPENRVPTPEEKAVCRVYLDAQISIIKPKIILLCGATAVKSMLNTNDGISKIRGQWFEGPFGSKMMPIFHPSYLLRNQSNEKGSPRWLMWKDIELIKSELDKYI